MEQPSCQLSLAVIRLQSPLQWARMNTGPSKSPLVTFIIMFDEHIIMESHYWGFLQTQRASHPFIYCLFIYLLLLASKEHADDIVFQKFCHQFVHTLLAKILAPLKGAMEVLKVAQFPDGHLCWAIYSIGPYISDYPEQAILTCIVQDWCAKYVFLPLSTRMWTNFLGVLLILTT